MNSCFSRTLENGATVQHVENIAFISVVYWLQRGCFFFDICFIRVWDGKTTQKTKKKVFKFGYLRSI